MKLEQDLTIVGDVRRNRQDDSNFFELHSCAWNVGCTRSLLLLHAENSDAQLASSDAGYIFGKQAGDTQLLVGDGETAVIGGLTVTQTTQSKAGIPLLVDLPLIGKLFGQTRTQDEKRDLLILVTPHIIDDGAPIPGTPSNSMPPATR